MTRTYHIEGMTCNGCRTSVELKLNALAGVQSATVHLEKEEAVITMDTHVATAQFQNRLPEKYRITEKTEKSGNANTKNNSAFAKTATTPSKLKQLKPLLLILGYIAVATLLLNYQRNAWDGAMLDFMGLFFIVFSFFKILDVKGFSKSFRMYDPLARIFPAYGMVYPFIETALGLMLLMRFNVTIALIVTLAILTITTLGVTKTLVDKKSIQCACLGTALKLPMTEATFIENAIMIVMAVIMLIRHF